jgi:anti-sigma factor RsiW
LLCKKVYRQLADFLEGELDPALAADLARHLEHCDDCRIIVDTTRRTIEIYCHCEPAPLPADVRRRLDQALAAKLRRTPTRT